jgi:NhaP-type Na+/H+ or K+/H+ antiporter
MAGPILLVAVFLSAIMIHNILGYGHKNFKFADSLMYGAIISATDPVAVVSLLNELGAPKRLQTIIEGESLLNDGTAMVCFLVF